MKKLFTLTLSVCLAALAFNAEARTPDQEFVELRQAYEAKLRPLNLEANLAWWEASITGKDDAYARRRKADEALSQLHSDRQAFARIKQLKQAGLKDPRLARELLMMYFAYLPRQADPALNQRIIALEGEVDQIFNTHRSQVDSKELTENEVRKVLTTTRSSDQARQAWSGYMAVGKKLDGRLKELVKLRNQVAHDLGYPNYFVMQLETQELTEAELLGLYDELDQLTSPAFAQLKAEIDAHMKERFSLKPEQLRPWHTDDLFFQEAPNLAKVKMDDLYQGKDPVKLSQAHYESLGYDVAPILKRSDLYERPGKSPHAFCTNIDRDQDIRVLCNVVPNASWMDTVHHELGHGVYDHYIGADVPYLLHDSCHILTTEGMALMFGAFTGTPEFLREVVQVPPDRLPAYAAEARRKLRSEKLIFSRWAQVVLRFEQAMYSHPDQDLNRLWWQLKKRYQLLNPPDDLSGADYAAKIHIASVPVYYHNYLLGDLFASQVWTYAADHFAKGQKATEICFFGNRPAGDYFRQQVFAPGSLCNWRELTQKATGAPLSPAAYAKLYVR